MAKTATNKDLWRRIGGGLATALLALAVLLYGYGVAGLIGGALPVNGKWREPADGVRIYVEDNGIHTGIVLPKHAAGVSWDDLVRPEDLAYPRYAGYSHLSFGWGDRAFYIGTPTWADLRPTVVLRAATGSERTVLHVDHIPEPKLDAATRAILLRPEEYRRLAGFIRASFAVGPHGRAASVHGYGGWDAFYEARGTYSALRTCNAWTGEAFKAAGVKMGAWTPFPLTVMRWL